ncbi:MAG: A/G-specific adenine glycosylase, partial [Candidatus Hecatellales archaeon]
MSEKLLLRREIFKNILPWFYKRKRDLPWRRNPTPYSVWISEIMLQQTAVKAVVPYYLRWMKRFPSLSSLARSRERDILTLWEGLGYYSRARSVLKASRIIQKKYKGRIPDEYSTLSSLPGIGPYTASAILSIAYGEPCPVIDANVKRVIQRFLGFRSRDRKGEKSIRGFLEQVIPVKEPGSFNEALMELGQTVCLVESPLCHHCPLKKGCVCLRKNLQQVIPGRREKLVIKKKTTLLIFLHRKKIFLMPKEKGLFKGLWLIPGLPRNGNGSRGIESYIRREMGEAFSLSTRLPEQVH